MTQAILVLADGATFRGRSFGYPGRTFGEIVFNTSMSGYQEILTDPSYCGQIVVMTYPMIGNYGIHTLNAESDRIQASGLIVKEYAGEPSNWRSEMSLKDYLVENRIVGVEELPTREIVRHIRDAGAMPGILACGDFSENELKSEAAALVSMSGRNLVPEVATSMEWTLPGGGQKVIVYDFGVKRSILNSLAERECQITVVPPNTPAESVLERKPDGVLLSNGPGDPAACGTYVNQIRQILGKVPVLGICLGHQLLSLALGAKTFKLKFGHRGGNQPVKDLPTGKILITAQNHGFAVSPDHLPSSMEITQINLNDATVEAFRHKEFPILSVQYHPEAAPGPNDAKNIFDAFLEMMRA